jgi:hypothetical protein
VVWVGRGVRESVGVSGREIVSFVGRGPLTCWDVIERVQGQKSGMTELKQDSCRFDRGGLERHFSEGRIRSRFYVLTGQLILIARELGGESV